MDNKYIHDGIHNTKAAESIIPFLISTLKISSVADIGCGTGTWLKVCSDLGVGDFLGVEGFHLDTNKLVISIDKVLLHDLEQPLMIQRRFDLVISLEVAEHLHESVARQFVDGLTKLSDVILFSAAIPFQGGQNHINEQWQDYWIRLFTSYDYLPFDIIRPHFWNDPNVDFWYKQNSILFIKNESQKKNSVLHLPSFQAANIVHPELYSRKSSSLSNTQNGRNGIVSAMKIVIKSLTAFIRR